MKQVTNQPPIAPSSPSPSLASLRLFPVTLRDGREITIREMSGRDLLYIEEDLKDCSDLRRTFNLASRLSGGQVSFDEVADLSYEDIKAITEVIGKAGGADEGDPK